MTADPSIQIRFLPTFFINHQSLPKVIVVTLGHLGQSIASAFKHLSFSLSYSFFFQFSVANCMKLFVAPLVVNPFKLSYSHGYTQHHFVAKEKHFVARACM